MNEKRIILRNILPELVAMADPCRLCPRQCGVRRKEGERGICGAGWLPRVAAALPHCGEEPPLSGTHGSGTVFFSHCHLRCLYCQNHEISHGGLGRDLSSQELASIFMELQEAGCHNINLVSATPFMHMVAEALLCALDQGFGLPIVLNCSGYENVDVIRLLDGIVDIYLPDMKYGDNGVARQMSAVVDYVECTLTALTEMWRQTGPLVLDEDGIARRGIIVRHLVLPNGLSDSRLVFRLLAEIIGEQCPVAIMGQYFPTPLVAEHPLLKRRITPQEWQEALSWLDMFDLNREGWSQEPVYEGEDAFIPSFTSDYVFPFILRKELKHA